MVDHAKLLVVDDDEVICRSCERIFAPRGFDLTTSSNPREGLSLAAERDYAVILLDIKMPGMDGIQFLAALRRMRPDVPVIFITGHASMSNAARAVQLGASGYVTKPFTPEQIARSVQRVLAARQKKANGGAGAVSPGVESWAPRPGEYYFFEESWFQLAWEGSVRPSAMHQHVPDRVPFEASVRAGAVLRPSQGTAVKGIDLPRMGDAVSQGLPLASLSIANGRPSTVPSPLSGVVVAVHLRLRESFAPLWEDPYGEGWIACISPTRFEEDVRHCTPRPLHRAGR